METVIQGVMPFKIFSQVGAIVLTILLTLALILAISAVLNLCSSSPRLQKSSTGLLITINIFLVMGFLWICWFHWQIYLKLPLEELTVNDGVVSSRQDPRKKISYAELTAGKEIVRKLDHKPELKKPSEFKYMNRPVLRRDSVEKVSGTAKYAGDIQLPGMLYARILRPPSHASKLISADTSVQPIYSNIITPENISELGLTLS